MKPMIYGYARVSTGGQREAAQVAPASRGGSEEGIPGSSERSQDRPAAASPIAGRKKSQRAPQVGRRFTHRGVKCAENTDFGRLVPGSWSHNSRARAGSPR